MDDFNNDNTPIKPNSLHAHEVEEFRVWRDTRIREAAIAEAHSIASAEARAAEAAADSGTLKKLEDRGLSLSDCFGNGTTERGRNFLVNLHRSAFKSKSGDYTRLRRIAQGRGLVQ
jgi:hypothetical protein